MSILHWTRSLIDGAKAPPADDSTAVSLAGAYRAYRAGARFVDVRQTFEWRDGHIAGSVHRPVDELVSDPRLTVTADALIVTYCAAGARAARAAAALRANGYARVRALAVGYGDWRRAGYPVERPERRDPSAR